MDTFIELNNKTVDFAVIDLLLAEKIVGQGDFADLAIVDTIDIDPEVYSIGCRKGSDFDEKINEALVELLNEGKIEELAAKYEVRVTDSLMALKTAK
jgi:polar amino acid transport system substrate-binding protein